MDKSLSPSEIPTDRKSDKSYVLSNEFSFDNLGIADSRLLPIRRELYHSASPGYFIIRNFLTPNQVSHLQKLWDTDGVERFHAPYESKEQFFFGCPNYASISRGNKIFFNFLWAKPLDELTFALAIQIQLLRSRIEGHFAGKEIFPIHNKCVSYRVVNTKNSENWIAPHTDYFHPEAPLNANHDLTRLQATLFLSEYGRDYQEGGFTLKNNQGTPLLFGRDVHVSPGDLVIWRYNNEHSVQKVKSSPDQLGFMRILFPPESIVAAPKSFGKKAKDRMIQAAALVASKTLPTSTKKKIKKMMGRS